MTKRVQLSRRAGWRLADHSASAVVVSRPSRWGNPFNGPDRQAATAAFEEMLRGDRGDYPADEEIRRELAGKDLACWCPPGPCHSEALLRIAAGGAA